MDLLRAVGPALLSFGPFFMTSSVAFKLAPLMAALAFAGSVGLTAGLMMLLRAHFTQQDEIESLKRQLKELRPLTSGHGP